VPRLRDTFAVGNVVAAKTIRPKEEDPWSFDGDDPGGLHARMLIRQQSRLSRSCMRLAKGTHSSF
jgi:hypothetical protein